MSNQTNNGGDAFPCTHSSWRGMTLRDYFAAKAMQGLLSDTTTMGNISKDAKTLGVCSVKYVVSAAYDFADAMLAARGEDA